jgi:anti-sigma factor RsiW
MPHESSGQADSPLDHKDVELYISRVWDGDLAPEEIRSLEEHLRSCPECAARSKKFLSFLARLGQFTEPDESAADE